MAVMGLATAQDFVSGEMKGSDAPQAFKIGGDDPADDLFVKTMQPVPLSGNNWSMFDSLNISSKTSLTITLCILRRSIVTRSSNTFSKPSISASASRATLSANRTASFLAVSTSTLAFAFASSTF